MTSTRTYRRVAHWVVPFLLVAATGCSTLSSAPISEPYRVADNVVQAPFGSDVSPKIANYSRVAPYVAVAGELEPDGVEEAKAHGFKLIVDIRGPKEDGVLQEQAKAEAVGINYLNLPLAADARAWEQVETLEKLLTERQRFPVLVHCGSANRAGAFWALYRYRQGVPPMVAIEEGRAAGMRSKESLVRELLGVAPEAQ